MYISILACILLVCIHELSTFESVCLAQKIGRQIDITEEKDQQIVFCVGKKRGKRLLSV